VNRSSSPTRGLPTSLNVVPTVAGQKDKSVGVADMEAREVPLGRCIRLCVLHVALRPKCHFSLGLTNRFTAASVTVAMVVGPETGDNTNAPIRGELCDTPTGFYYRVDMPDTLEFIESVIDSAYSS